MEKAKKQIITLRDLIWHYYQSRDGFWVMECVELGQVVKGGTLSSAMRLASGIGQTAKPTQLQRKWLRA